MVDMDVQQRGVGHEPDEDEHPADGQLLGVSMLLVANKFHLVTPDDLLHLGVENEVDLRVGTRSVDQDGLRAQLLAPVDDVDLRGVARQEVPLLNRSIATAHHRQLLVLEEGAVADGAVAHTATPVLLLSRHREVPRQAACGKDQGGGAELGAHGYAAGAVTLRVDAITEAVLAVALPGDDEVAG